MHSVDSLTLRQKDAANSRLVFNRSSLPCSESSGFLPVYDGMVRQRRRQTGGKSERTEPLRIKAAPLLTSCRLRSTMRSIFKHNSLQCIPAPLTLSRGMNKNATQVYSEGSAQTNTPTLKRSIGSAYEIHMDARRRVCAFTAASVCWKPDQRDHYWRQLEWSAAAHELEVCLSPSPTPLFFFLLPSSFWFSLSLVCLSSHLSRVQ